VKLCYKNKKMNIKIEASYPAGEPELPSASHFATVAAELRSGGNRGELDGTDSGRTVDCFWYKSGVERGVAPTMEGSIMSIGIVFEGSLNLSRLFTGVLAGSAS
jgi:hypothetical protein